MAFPPFNQTVEADSMTRYSTKFQLGSSQYFNANSGRYVTLATGTGYYNLSVAGDTQVDGWVDDFNAIGGTGNPTCSPPFLSGSTAGAVFATGTKDIFDVTKGYWMGVKAGSTVAATNLDQEYDLLVEGSTTTTKQVVDITATSQKVVKIIDIDLVNNIVKVIAVQQV